MTGPRIAVLGTGANGAGIAADLVRAGHDVTLIDQWPENVEAIRAHGVRVEMPQRRTVTPVHALHLCEVATLRRRFDLVLLLVKAYDTRWACELIAPYLAEDGLVVGLQNGMSVDDLVDVLGADRVLAAVIEVTAAMYEAGLVERHTPPSGSWFALGGVTVAAQARAAEAAGVLGAAGTVAVVDDIRSAKWMKLSVNAAELVPSAILDLPLLEARRLPGMHDFMLAAGREAVRTAVALGFGVVPIFGLTEVDPARPEAFLDTMLDTVYEKWSLPQTRTTVLQDWMKGRRSEASEINGLVVREQERLGGSAPANAVTLQVALEIERGEAKAGVHQLDRLLAALPAPPKLSR
jgi:2-dehydropantoate 2-reductase